MPVETIKREGDKSGKFIEELILRYHPNILERCPDQEVKVVMGEAIYLEEWMRKHTELVAIACPSIGPVYHESMRTLFLAGFKDVISAWDIDIALKRMEARKLT